MHAQRLREAAQRRKHRGPDQYTPTTPEALQAALRRARELFPEPIEVKQARAAILNQELREHAGHNKTRLKDAA